MATAPGCSTLFATYASSKKRRLSVGERAASGCSTLIAARVPFRWVAAYTAPMPPTPSKRSRRHLRSSTVPAARTDRCSTCSSTSVGWLTRFRAVPRLSILAESRESHRAEHRPSSIAHHVVSAESLIPTYTGVCRSEEADHTGGQAEPRERMVVAPVGLAVSRAGGLLASEGDVENRADRDREVLVRRDDERDVEVEGKVVLREATGSVVWAGGRRPVREPSARPNPDDIGEHVRVAHAGSDEDTRAAVVLSGDVNNAERAAQAQAIDDEPVEADPRRLKGVGSAVAEETEDRRPGARVVGHLLIGTKDAHEALRAERECSLIDGAVQSARFCACGESRGAACDEDEQGTWVLHHGTSTLRRWGGRRPFCHDGS